MVLSTFPHFAVRLHSLGDDGPTTFYNITLYFFLLSVKGKYVDPWSNVASSYTIIYL